MPQTNLSYHASRKLLSCNLILLHPPPPPKNPIPPHPPPPVSFQYKRHHLLSGQTKITLCLVHANGNAVSRNNPLCASQYGVLCTLSLWGCEPCWQCQSVKEHLAWPKPHPSKDTCTSWPHHFHSCIKYRSSEQNT